VASSVSFFQEYLASKKPEPLRKQRALDRNQLREHQWLVDGFKRKIIEGRTSIVEDTIFLGSFLRIQGEALRAFKLHKTLLNRSNIDRNEKLFLYQELGTDVFYLRKGDLGGAYFQQCLVWNRKHIPSLHFLARAHEFLGEYQKAVPLIKRLIRLGQKDQARLAYVLSELAYTFMDQGDFSKARKTAEEAMSVDATCPAATLAYADSLLLTKNYPAALETLRTFVASWPDLTFMAIKRIEDVHYRQDNYEELETTLRSCLQKNPDNAYVMYWIGKVLRKKKRQADGLAYFKEALELRSNEVNAMRELIHYNLNADDRGIVGIAKKFFEELRSSKKMVCTGCHAKHKTMHWFCAHCGNWGVFGVRYEFSGP